MGRGSRGLLLAAALVVVLLVAGGAVVVLRGGEKTGTSSSSSPVTSPADAPGIGAGTDAGGDRAVIAVAVATLWLEPEITRPVDEPSLRNPVDVDGWVAAMSVPDKLWLVGKLATQALYGDRVVVLETKGSWTKVAVERQPSSLDPRGYPGWLPTAQLSFRPLPATGRQAVVTATRTTLTTASGPMAISFNTTLPVVSTDRASVTVATPSGATGVLAAADVEVFERSPRRPTGADLVRSAQAFSGLPYLWAGTSASGFDCSGFTSSVYGAHGLVIPRDADDQARAGTPIEPDRLEPGDLVFYASEGGRGQIHHVSMYVGNGLMIQSPSTGRTVETVAVDSPAYAREFWGARRYLAGIGS